MQHRNVTLDDKYALTEGRAFMTGIHALVRLPVDMARYDRAAGLNTAGFISGYRGSPLGGYDQQLKFASKFLDESHVVFKEGLNEDLAATAVWGSQQTALFPGAKYDGVFGIWYGKAPGVDRSGDVFKHANFSGVAPLGGAVAILGDDPTCKSSTLPSQSEYAMMDCEIPVLNPATVQEVLDYGVYALRMSRFAGCWTSIVALADTMDGGAVVDVDLGRLDIVTPSDEGLTEARFIKRKDGRLEKESVHRDQRLPAAQRFARANALDKQILGAPYDQPKKRKIGIVTVGRASRDVYEAMDALGLTEEIAADLGLCIFKVGMSWPLEPTAITEFARGLDTVIVIEHKRPLLEDQMKAILYAMPEKQRPQIIGKRRDDGTTLFPDSYVIPVPTIAAALFDLLPKGPHAQTAQDYFHRYGESQHKAGHREDNNIRSPFFCSGCPHNTSTKLPEGSRALAGIGCHFLASIHDPNTDMHTQMGGEGVPWIGMAPFTDEAHIFANLGDGTYSHSGSLAIRAAVAAGSNITYKLLYNDAVAMTGGQAPEISGSSVPEIVTQLVAEAVSKIVIVADDPDRYKTAKLPAGVDVFHRDELMVVQENLRTLKGVSVLLYDQTCATEKRRRRKRGLMEQEPRRMFINTAVCENCGDCSVQSQCLSIEPTWTEFGLKRLINQSTCNQDLSCVKGFCPSFVTVLDGTSRASKKGLPNFDSALIPLPSLPDVDATYNIVVTGIGGAGVTTISALLGMAAHIDGRASTTLDSTGLAQKGGAVTSHVRIAQTADDIRSGSVPPASADIVIGGDIIVSHDEGVMQIFGHDRTHIVINSEIVPTAEYLGARDLSYGKTQMLSDINTTSRAMTQLNAQLLSTRFLGDAIYANMIVLGAAWQKGRVPVTLRALYRAIKLNGTKIDANIAAFELGRLWIHDKEKLEDSLPDSRALKNPRIMPIEELITHRMSHLTGYQNAALAARYEAMIRRVQLAEKAIDPTLKLTREAAIQYARLLAYKDEYEVARLYTDGRFGEDIAKTFADGYKMRLNLAPPLLGKRDKATGHLKKTEFGPWMFKAFKVMTKFKGLRGTAFDPFGKTAERKAERALITDFEARLEMVLRGLSAGNHALAIRLIGAVDDIRGYGHVKEKAMAETAVKIKGLTRQWDKASGAAQKTAKEPAE